MIATASDTAGRPALVPPLALTLGRVRLDDRPRVLTAFSEGHKHAPGVDRMPWRYYNRFVVPDLAAALAHPDTQLIGAYALSMLPGSPDELVGWIAFARGRRVDTVHWVSVPFWFPLPHTACDGCEDSRRHATGCPFHRDNRVEIRRRGIMGALFDAAALQERIAYTFRGAKHEHRSDGQTMDERLLPWLQSRGHKPGYVKWEEWKTWRS